MKIIYVCSKYAGKVKENIEEAKRFSNFILKKGELPICVHLFLNDITGFSEDKGDREKLLKLGIDYLRVVKEVWVLEINKISKGMALEIREAKKIGIKIRKFKKEENGGYKELYSLPNN